MEVIIGIIGIIVIAIIVICVDESKKVTSKNSHQTY